MKNTNYSALSVLHNFFQLCYHDQNTFSPCNQTSVTKERMGLSASTAVWAALRVTGPHREIGGRPQKSSAASGTKNSGATYRTWLTMGYGKSPAQPLCVCALALGCVCVCESVCDNKAALATLLELCVVKHVSLSSKLPSIPECTDHSAPSYSQTHVYTHICYKL